MGKEEESRIMICEDSDWESRAKDNKFILRESLSYSTEFSVVSRKLLFLSS